MPLARFSEAMLKNLVGFGGVFEGAWCSGTKVENEEFRLGTDS